MKWLDKTIRVLRDGGIIAFPTDTVYGIGCDSTNERAIERTYRLKRRARNKPLIIFIPSSDGLNKIASTRTGEAKVLSKNFWPGPLSLVLKAKKDCTIKAEDGTVGVRVPDEEHILTILNNYPRPLATTSCNVENSPTLSNSNDVRMVFGNSIDLIIDGVIPEPALPSTVVSISPPRLLRRGKLSVFEIEKRTGIRFPPALGIKIGILFLCSANLCRSQMAEGVARKMGCNDNIFVGSAGINAVDGLLPSFFAVQVMQEEDVDISKQVSRRVSRKILYDYDLILCMEEEDRQWIASNYPEVSERVFLITKYGREDLGEDISDPSGGSIELYRRTRDRIRDEVKRILNHINLGYFKSEMC